MNRFKCSKFTFLHVICLFSIMVYVDFIPESIRSYMVYVLWGIAFVECIIRFRWRLPLVTVKYIFSGILIFALIVFISFNGKNYFSSPTLYSIGLALGLLLIGTMYGQKLSQEDVEVICQWYVLGAAILSVYLFVTNFANGFNLNSRLYLQIIGKNSVGQILSTAAIMLLLSIKRVYGKWSNIIKAMLALFMIVLMFLIRSRTSMFCFAASVLLLILSRRSNKRLRRWLVAVVCITVVIILTNENLRNIVVNNILLANRNRYDLNDITSGRISMYENFYDLMKGNELTGIGGRYYESYYLSVLIQFGYLIGTLLVFYVIQMLIYAYRLSKKVKYGQLLIIISISYALNGLLEGLPPYGPGVKNFALWLLLGMAASHEMSMKIEANNI